MTLPFEYHHTPFKFGEIFPRLAKVHCDFCRSKDPAKIELKVYEEREINGLLIEAGWSILCGKDTCPACAKKFLQEIER